jgi:hypothetical protein
VLIAAALLAALLPIPSRIVERTYSLGVFPRLQHALTTVSNLTWLAFFDLFVLVAIGSWLWLTVRDWRRAASKNRWRFAGRLGIRTATLAAGAYLAFMVCWGWNYQRRPLTDTLQFDSARLSRNAARQLTAETMSQLNALYASAHREGWVAADRVDSTLADAFWRAQAEVGTDTRIVPGRPKRTLFDAYFRRAGVAGMTDPYFLETLIASDLLPFERPHVVAHEWAHLAGFNDEGEANFVAWIATLHGSAAQQYSGWLFLYSEVANAVERSEFRAMANRLEAGPREDLLAIRNRLARNVNRQISAVGWKVYDKYLKANRVEGGTRSYGQVVTLILGTTFDADRRPKRR